MKNLNQLINETIYGDGAMLKRHIPTVKLSNQTKNTLMDLNSDIHTSPETFVDFLKRKIREVGMGIKLIGNFLDSVKEFILSIPLRKLKNYVGYLTPEELVTESVEEKEYKEKEIEV